MILLWIVVFGLLGSIGGVALAALLLISPENVRRRLMPSLLGFATGTLLGAAFLILLPEAIEDIPAATALATVLGGMLAFFVLEKLVILRHCHDDVCDVHAASGPLILIGDAFHNFVDGVIIAAAFLISIPAGIAASIATITHEAPQELGDFAILLDHGYTPRRALIWNTISGAATLPGAVATYFALRAVETAVPYTLAVAAASFIYIATANLIPNLHRRAQPRQALWQFAFIVLGVGVILLIRLAHH